jgi:isopenicillin N synthase-like dioxygenase
MTDAVPTIDIAPFLSGDPAGKANVARQVAEAAQTIGFVVLSGHGIPQDLFDTVFAKGFAFFDLPDS